MSPGSSLIPSSRGEPTGADQRVQVKNAGHDSPEATRRLLGTLSRPGRFALSEKRADDAGVPANESDCLKTDTDPGCVDVVHTRTTDLESPSPPDVPSHSTSCARSSTDYIATSGTFIQRRKEAKRMSRQSPGQLSSGHMRDVSM